jgi:hypothetical protein
MSARSLPKSGLGFRGVGLEQLQESSGASVFGIDLGTPQHFRWLSGIVKWVLVLNLIDAVLTLLWVRLGLAAESNTLIDELVAHDALAFIAVKLGLVGLGSWLLWNRRHSPLAVVGIFVVFVTYYGIVAYHVQYASGLLVHFLGR